jgi:hypothetical protein
VVPLLCIILPTPKGQDYFECLSAAGLLARAQAVWSQQIAEGLRNSRSLYHGFHNNYGSLAMFTAIRAGGAIYLANLHGEDYDLMGSVEGEGGMMNVRILGLAAISLTIFAEPAFATVGAPGPIAGVGLPAVALIGGAYWVGRKLFGRKK